MIAFHFPPMSESSGYLRPLRFAEFLRTDFGWTPQVLTVAPYLYPRVSDEHDAWIQENLLVRRAWGLDTRKHLSLAGKYLETMAAPDQWISWYPFAVLTGLRMIRKTRPDIIWSTCPIATTNLVAATLSRVSGIPWVADFRDPMTIRDYPPGKVRHRVTRWAERTTIASARHVCFAADHTRRHYAEQYPNEAHKFSVIPNGYDEVRTTDTNDNRQARHVPTSQRDIVLLHAGALFPDGRNPKTLLLALKKLLDAGHDGARRTKIHLRAPGFTIQYQQDISDLGLHEHVKLLQALPYQAMREEMYAADGLLLFQGAVYAHSIPAKAFEYLASYKPIVALITPNGETSATFKRLRMPYLADIDCVDNVTETLLQFYADHDNSSAFVAPEQEVKQMSRRRQTARLNTVLESLL